MLGSDPHPCKQLTGNTTPPNGKTTPSLKEVTSCHLARGSRAEQLVYLISTYLLYLPLAIIHSTPEKFSHPAKLPLQTPPLYLLQLLKWL
jgi:hypothetical protein